MLVIVSMETTRMVNSSFGFGIGDIEVFLRDDSPSCFWNHPEWRNPLVLREVVSLWHILISKVDLEAWVYSCLCGECVVERLKIGRVLGSQTKKWPSIHMLNQICIENILQLDHSTCVCSGHAVVRDDYHIDNLSQI